MPLVLIAGFGEDSGKTTLAVSLVAALRRSGFNAAAFKPLGATRIWLHPSVLRVSSERGYLVTWDGYVLSKAVDGDPEMVNPVAGFTVPLDPFKGSGYSEVLSALRVSSCTGSRLHLYEPRTLEAAPPSLASSLLQVLEGVDPKPLPVSRGGLMRVIEEAGLEAADDCLKTLLSRSDVVVVESNSDVAAPTPLTARPDLVVAVAPGRAAIYRGDRWTLALSLVAPHRPHAAVVEEIVKLLKPLKILDLPLVEDPLEGIPENYIEAVIEEVESLAEKGSTGQG